MDEAHDVESVSFRGSKMLLRVDGKDYEVEVSPQSQLLASATPTQRQELRGISNWLWHTLARPR